MKVVSDSSSLIGLATISKFNLLRRLYGKVLIPEAVYEEVVVAGEGDPGSEETAQAIKDGWIQRKRVRDRLAVHSLTEYLGQGEAEAIILAAEEKADLVILDDSKSRKTAILTNLHVIGVIGILCQAIENGLKIDIKKDPDYLKAKDFRIGKELYQKILKKYEKG